MKLNPEEQELFQNLQGTSTGVILSGFLKRLEGELCDLRSMEEYSEADAKARLKMAKLLHEEVIIRLIPKINKTNTNTYA
jgi:hypothetical protein